MTPRDGAASARGASDGAAPAPGLAPFAERYRRALADPNVRDGLLGFQRSWRETRDAQIASYRAALARSTERTLGRRRVVNRLMVEC